MRRFALYELRPTPGLIPAPQSFCNDAIVSITQRLGALVVAALARAFTRTPLIRLFNPVMSRLLVSPLPAGPNALLTVRGRRTGQPRSSPIAFLDFGEWGLLQAASNDANWVHNLHASRVAVISRGGAAKTFDAKALAPENPGHVVHDLLAPFPRSRLIGAVTREHRPPVAVLHYFRLRVDDALADTSTWRGASPCSSCAGAPPRARCLRGYFGHKQKSRATQVARLRVRPAQDSGQPACPLFALSI